MEGLREGEKKKNHRRKTTWSGNRGKAKEAQKIDRCRVSSSSKTVPQNLKKKKG